MTVNKVILVGNLGADPEVRTTNSGSKVANLRIATSSREKDSNGDYQDATEWHRVVCFGKTAENVERYLSKGRQVYIEGKIKTNKWQDKDGADRYTTEVVAFQVNFLGGKGDGAERPASSAGGLDRNKVTEGYGGYGAKKAPPADDIPF